MIIMMMLVVSIVGMMMKQVAVMKSCIVSIFMCDHMIKYDGEERESNHLAADLRE